MKTNRIKFVSVYILFFFTLVSSSVMSQFNFPSVSDTTFHPHSIKIELHSWIDQVKATHPMLSYSVDYDKIIAKRDEIESRITGSMNQLAVYRLFTEMNSVFADGHFGIGLRLRILINDALAQGDRLFPLPVYIDDDYRLMVKTESLGLEAGTVIKSINGVDANEITRTLERRFNGDNAELRRAYAAIRFAEHLWAHYGTSEAFDLLTNQGEISVDGSNEIMPHMAYYSRSMIEKAPFEIIEDSVAYFQVGSFAPSGMEELTAWFEYTDSLFTQVATPYVKHLVVDVRFNSGGWDDTWIHGILPYVAKRKWQRMLHFLGRVRDTDGAFPGREGEVAIFDYPGEYEVVDSIDQLDVELYVVVGDATYSSSIMFSAAVKDNGLGKIVGQETNARGCQTGMPRLHDMPVTGLRAFTPIHWYQRNTGASCYEGIMPDIELEDNPFDEREIIDALIQHIKSRNS